MSGKDGTASVSPDMVDDATGFVTEYAKSNRSTCQVCKEKIDKDIVRLGVEVPNPYRDGHTMPLWGHPECVFVKLKKPGKPGRMTITSVDDIKGFDDLKKKDQTSLRRMVEKHADAVKAVPDEEWTELIKDGQFWKIARVEKVTHTSYGNCNERNEALTMVKEHASAKAAEAYEEKMIHDKKKKGYLDADDVPEEAEEEEKEEEEEEKSKKRKDPKVKSEDGSTEANTNEEEQPDIYGFKCEYAKSNRSRCKGCNDLIDKGELRIAKIVDNPYVKSKDPDKPATMPVWYHEDCFWKNMRKGNVKKSRLTDVDTVEGFDSLKSADQKKFKAKVEKENEAHDTFLDHQAPPGTRPPADQVYLESTSGENNKWWGITQNGSSTRTRWGELGDEEGHFVLKEFDNDVGATAYLNKMVTSKLKGSYELISIEGVKIEDEDREERAKDYVPEPKGKKGGGKRKRGAAS